MKKRIPQIEFFMQYPSEVQIRCFKELIAKASNTEWGKMHEYKSIKTPEQYQQRISIRDYHSLKPYVERMLMGQQNLLWPSTIHWFAKSSGTTSEETKYIPISKESLQDCHFKGGKDMLALYCSNHYPHTKIFTGKALTLGGSYSAYREQSNVFCGDLSALLIKNLPFWATYYCVPDAPIALLEDYEEKIEKIAKITKDLNITSISGIPTWNVILIKKVLELTSKTHLLEVWPDLELYFHGAVNFKPYHEHFKKLIPTSSMCYLETYNASEGFFGIQDQPNSNELLLILDGGIFYEFLPLGQLHDTHPTTLQLHEVALNKNYALVITTNAGLWRYLLGDTIRFTSLSPYRIQVTGRIKHFINAFGEEMIIDHVEHAVAEACKQTNAVIRDYTVAPLYFQKNKVGSHEWIIEFEQQPSALKTFCYILDTTLRQINFDYDAKRSKGIVLSEPIVHNARKGTFYAWMKQQGKLGGQHKVPRLSSDRGYVESILGIMKYT